MQLGLPESLPTLVAKRFTAARDASHLVFSSTHLSIINAAGILVSDNPGQVKT
jgi:ATP adenylyltransferase